MLTALLKSVNNEITCVIISITTLKCLEIEIEFNNFYKEIYVTWLLQEASQKGLSPARPQTTCSIF